ncbi:MAG: atpC [Frankiales bacterium]|nr:atpC [Frankiales bacterium]
MAELHVELVSVEREVWSGEATQVIARTTEGEIGILPGHAPLLGLLAEGYTVTVRGSGGQDVVAAVHGGFLSVTEQGVTILAERAELSTDVDTGRAQAALDRARSEGDEAASRRAESRLRAVGSAV